VYDFVRMMTFASCTGCCLRNKRVVSSTISNSTQHNDEDYYDFLAPSVYHLQTTFRKEVRDFGLDENATLYDIETLRVDEPGLIRRKGINVTCPIDHEKGAAYVHCLEAEGADHFGLANYMLSYAWGYKYDDIVDTLVNFCKENSLSTKTTYIWICAFCNNQHRVVERNVPFDEFRRVFKKRVEGIGNVLAMMTPWNDPGYLKRVWCIFEMYSANTDDKCNIKVIMPPREQKSLVAAVLKPADTHGRSGLDDLFTALASTKVEDAEASQLQDKLNILKLVEEGPGCLTLDMEINRLLSEWIRDTVLHAVEKAEATIDGETDPKANRETATFLTFCASFFSVKGSYKEALDLHAKGLELYKTLLDHDEQDAKELMARCYNNMGTEYESLGRYEEALESHQKCRETFESIYGSEHENTSVSYFNIGAVLKRLERNEEALEMYQKSLDIDTKSKGDRHIDVGLTLTYIGRVKQENKEYDEALELYQKSLSIREETYGTDHPDTSIGYGDMGLLYHAREEYDEAIKMHKKAIMINERLQGNLHPDTASIYQNIGGAYYEKGLFDKALEFHKKAKNAYYTTLGADHPKSKVSNEWVSLVEDAITPEK